jgi:hypothetical protein
MTGQYKYILALIQCIFDNIVSESFPQLITFETRMPSYEGRYNSKRNCKIYIMKLPVKASPAIAIRN